MSTYSSQIAIVTAATFIECIEAGRYGDPDEVSQMVVPLCITVGILAVMLLLLAIFLCRSRPSPLCSPKYCRSRFLLWRSGHTKMPATPCECRMSPQRPLVNCGSPGTSESETGACGVGGTGPCKCERYLATVKRAEDCKSGQLGLQTQKQCCKCVTLNEQQEKRNQDILCVSSYVDAPKTIRDNI